MFYLLMLCGGAGLVISSSNYDYVLDSGKIYLILNVLGLLLEWEGGQNPTRDKVFFFFNEYPLLQVCNISLNLKFI